MHTNIYPIKIDFDEYQIYRLPYSDDKLRQLRKEHNDTHSFFRNDKYIYCSNKEGGENDSFGEPYTANVYSESEITSSLIKHIFFRSFKERFPDIMPTDFYPFRIYSTKDKDDLLYNLLPNSLRGDVCYKKSIEIQLRLLKPNSNPAFCFVVNTDRNWILNKSCDKINKEGFDLIGTEVLHSIPLPGLSDILAPNEEFIGLISSIRDGNAIVDTNDGEKELPLYELFLRKTTYNIKNYLTHMISEVESDKIFDSLKIKKEELFKAKKNYKEISNVIKTLAFGIDENKDKEPYLYMNKDGFCFTINSEPYTFQNKYNLQSPTFIFDYSGEKTESTFPDKGLNAFGPYDSYSFDIKSPHILCISLKSDRGYFTKFLSDLVEGLPRSRFFKKGFKKKYDLSDVVLEIKNIEKYNDEEIDKLISEFKTKPNLVVLTIPSFFRELDDANNPYYRIKAKFLSLEIPVQFIKDLNLKRYNEYILNSISLQMYAKLGGTPWLLPASRSVDRELIIGVGHSFIRQNTFSGNTKNRVVGITTVFSSDGQYLLSNKAKDVPYEVYFNELLSNLRESLDKIQNDQVWKEGDTIRLIFHVFKPIKNIEYEVICKLMSEYPQYKIQFAFVTISKKHPFSLFDQNQKGLGTGNLGEYIPARGSNFILDDSSCVIQMLGAKESKSTKQSSSSPILIRLRKPEGNYDQTKIESQMFSDLAYIVQQVYSFTYLSWRTFLPSEQPATMLYSNLIARLLGKLRKIDYWNPSVLNFSLKSKKWFL